MNMDTASMQLGRFHASRVATQDEVAEAQRFRASCFGLSATRDVDAWDNECLHIVIRDRTTGALACCYRAALFDAEDVCRSYSSQFYGLDCFKSFDGKMMEVGRFCLSGEFKNPDIVRLAWAMLTQLVDCHGVTLLFGCTSFPGTETDRFSDALAYLQQKSIAPNGFSPERRAQHVIPLDTFSTRQFDEKRALQQMPPLLRTYLGMRGWVSDHAVVDRHLGTLHVFTGVETAAIPHNRQAALRGLRRVAESMAERVDVAAYVE